MCITNYKTKGFIEHKPKLCIKFVFLTEDECRKIYFVNVAPFQNNGQVALCQILMDLGTRDLNVINKKFYLAKRKLVFRAETKCTCKLSLLSDRELYFKIYPASQKSKDIIAENEDQDTWIYIKKQADQKDQCYCMMKNLGEETPQIISQQSAPFLQTSIFSEQQNLFDYQYSFGIFPSLFYNADFFNSYQFLQSKYSSLLAVTELQSNKGEQRQNIKRQIESPPKEKIKQYQRMIREVIILVKTWRKMHQDKVCSLIEGAKLLKLPKKSLDDYYLVLRTGQILGFDFESNLGGKMGELRAFIRTSERKVSGKLSNHVNCFRLVEEIDYKKLLFSLNPTQNNQTSTEKSLKQDNFQKVLEISKKKVIIPIPIINK